MIDNNKKIKVDHVKSLPNVKWHLKNIKEPNLTNWVDGLIGGDGKVGSYAFVASLPVASAYPIIRDFAWSALMWIPIRDFGRCLQYQHIIEGACVVPLLRQQASSCHHRCKGDSRETTLCPLVQYII
jgi:hypothetical protein